MTQESPRCHVEIDASVRHVSKNFTRSDVNAHCVVGRRHVAVAVPATGLLLPRCCAVFILCIITDAILLHS